MVSISQDADLIDAARLLVAGTDFLAACNAEGILLGVVTKTDIVRHLSKVARPENGRVRDVMTRSVVSCRNADALTAVSRRMKDRHLKNIPVVDDDYRVTAILTARAILRVLLVDAEYQEELLIDYVKGIGYR